MVDAGTIVGSIIMALLKQPPRAIAAMMMKAHVSHPCILFLQRPHRQNYTTTPPVPSVSFAQL